MAFGDKEGRPKGQQEGGPHASSSRLVGGGSPPPPLSLEAEVRDRAFAFLTLSSFSQLPLLCSASS